MDDLGGKPVIFGNIHVFPQFIQLSYWPSKSSPQLSVPAAPQLPLHLASWHHVCKFQVWLVKSTEKIGTFFLSLWHNPLPGFGRKTLSMAGISQQKGPGMLTCSELRPMLCPMMSSLLIPNTNATHLPRVDLEQGPKVQTEWPPL